MEGTATTATKMERFRINAEVDSPGSSPHGLAYDGSSLWISDASERRIYRMNPETGQVLLTIPFDGEVAGCAWDGGHLWQADNRTKTVSQINPETGQIDMALACDTAGGVLGGLCFDGTDIWMAVTGSEQLRRVRMSDGAILKTHPVRKNILGLGYDRRRLWYTDADSARIRVVDPATGTELMSYELRGSPTGVAFTARNTFWFCDSAARKLVHVTLMTRS